MHIVEVKTFFVKFFSFWKTFFLFKFLKCIQLSDVLEKHYEFVFKPCISLSKFRYVYSAIDCWKKLLRWQSFQLLCSKILQIDCYLFAPCIVLGSHLGWHIKTIANLIYCSVRTFFFSPFSLRNNTFLHTWSLTTVRHSVRPFQRNWPIWVIYLLILVFFRTNVCVCPNINYSSCAQSFSLICDWKIQTL